MRGDRQRALAYLLERAGLKPSPAPARPSAGDVHASPIAHEMLEVYRALGGVNIAPAIRPGPWDLAFDGVAIELDEYLHFNRYRRRTLESPVYETLPRFPTEEYMALCEQFEPESLLHGKGQMRWSRSSSDTEFGGSSPPGDLSGAGPSRWKQRAFYDFVKDAGPLVLGIPVTRVAIWDTIEVAGAIRRVHEVLDQRDERATDALASLIRNRIS
ncbi:MAG: DUF7255 family protein [bacterium]